MIRSLAAVFLVPVLAGLLFAQDPPAPMPPQNDPVIQLNNITLEQFTQSVSKRTKKTFIYGDVVTQILRTNRVQLMAYREFNDKAQLFALFQSILQVQPAPLALVEAGDETYKILPHNDVRKMGLKVVTSAGMPNDTYVTRIFSLQHITAQEAFQALVNLIQPQAVAQFPASGIIVVSDSDFNVRRIEEVMKAVDVKKPDMIWRIVPLKKAVAADVELMMRNLLQGIVQAQRVRPGLAQPVQGNEQVTVVADRRTNSILMMAEPGRIDEVEALVLGLDKEPEFETSGTYIIPLRHRDADEIAKILNGLYRITTDTTTGLPSGGNTTSAVRPNQPLAPSAVAPQGGSVSVSGQQTGTEPTIIADKKTNSVILVTDRNTYQMLARLTQRLDRRRPQVLIKASVVEVQANDTFDLGVELARAVDPEGTITAFARTNMGYSVLSLVGGVPSIVPADTPGVTLAILKDRFGNIPGLFKALEDRAKISVIDEPEVATEDNGNANITLSNTVQIPVTTVTGTGISQTSFTPLKAETVLTISPHITQGGYLRLETEVKIEKFGATSASLPNQPPPINTRLVKTPFLMPAGRTAVIGGIVTSDRTDAETSIPLLGDIPVFGFLFRRQRQVELRRTLYVFITPYILYDDGFGDLTKLTQERMDEILFAQDGKYKDLMEGMNPRASGDPQPRSTFRFPEKPQQ